MAAKQKDTASPVISDAMEQAMVIGVSARALFDLDESHQVFVDKGLDGYIKHERELEDVPLEPGVAFHLVKGLLRLNAVAERQLVEVVILSSHHPDIALRTLNSINHYNLNIQRAAFTGGGDVVPYLDSFGVDLLLSRSEKDVQRAINGGVAAAVMYASPEEYKFDDGPITIAFDGDAVLFDDASERIFQEQGMAAFYEHESAKAKEPMAEGPFAKLLKILQQVQKATGVENRPFRLALVTARGGTACERVIRTLRAWEVFLDETYFLDGLKKDRILRALKPHMFFDDQHKHVEPASKVVPSGRVPYRSVS